ncbi:MAG: hypothetical protein AAGB34_01350 [Planctomycetota bacterium]
MSKRRRGKPRRRTKPQAGTPNWRAYRRAMAIMVAIAMVVVIVLFLRTRGVPAWYLQTNESLNLDIEEALGRGRGLESGIARAASGELGPTWSVKLLESDANAWLATRLPAWLANQGVEMPSGVSNPRVRIEPHLIRLVFTENREEETPTQAYGITIQVLQFEEGVVRCQLVSVILGRLAVPRTIMPSLPEDAIPNDIPSGWRDEVEGLIAGRTVSIHLDELSRDLDIEITSILCEPERLIVSGRSRVRAQE